MLTSQGRKFKNWLNDNSYFQILISQGAHNLRFQCIFVSIYIWAACQRIIVIRTLNHCSLPPIADVVVISIALKIDITLVHIFTFFRLQQRIRGIQENVSYQWIGFTHLGKLYVFSTFLSHVGNITYLLLKVLQS